MDDIDCTGPGRLSAVLPVREPLALVLMAALVCLCYANTLANPFIFDDIPNILDNRYVRLSRITADSLQDAAFKSPSGRRPLSNLSFAGNYYLDGYNVVGYRLINLLIHIAAGILLYGTVKAALAAFIIRASVARGAPTGALDGYEPGKTAVIPYLTAVLWLVHPLQTQSVTYLVQRMNALAALLFMAAFFLFLTAGTAGSGRKRALLYTGCAVSGLLALGSKEIAATLPFFLLLYRWFFILDLQWLRIRKELFVVFLAVAVFAGVALLFLGSSPVETILAGYSVRPFTLTQRLLTEFRVVVFYVTLFLFPHPSRLNLDHHFPVSMSLIDPVTTAFSMAAVCGALAAAVILAKRHRVISFCILWYLGNLAIESSIIGLEIIFEHRNYLPSMALALIAVWLPVRWVKSGKILLLLFGSLTVILSLWTWQRNQTWQDDLTLWEDCAHKSPAKARPVNKYGAALEKRGRLEEASRRYQQAIAASPTYSLPYYNLGNALVKLGQKDAAIVQYNRALYLKPDFNRARNNLALALADTGRVAAGIEQLETALAMTPDDINARMNLGSLLLRSKRFPEALENFLIALNKMPDSVVLRYNAGNALFAMGRLDEAVVQYREALKIDPSNVMAHNNLALTLVQKGAVAAAVRSFKAALKLEPENVSLQSNLQKALGLLAKGDP